MRINVTGFQKRVEKEISRKITEDFEKAAKDMITYFYASYSPHVYNRTDNYKEGVKITKSYKRNYGGITVDGSGMSDYVSNNNRSIMGKDYWGEDAHSTAKGGFVFDLIWNQGIRGLPATGENGWVNPHYMETYYYNHEFGVEGKAPHDIMMQLCDVWGDKRSTFIDSVVTFELDKLFE